MAVDIVIPFRNSPLTGNLELKYTLRGIEKHLSGVRYVHLIGDFPIYLNNVIGWPHTENNWYQYLTRNIYEKLLTACCNSAISDPFLYFNDDHFLLQNFEAEYFPFYHQGKTFDLGTGNYKVTIANTLARYPHANNYDIHAPILIFKEAFINSMSVLNWKIDFGYCIKTCYCAYKHARVLCNVMEYYPDHKLSHAPTEKDFREIEQRKFFSVGDRAMNADMRAYLQTLYPDKSKYEK